MSPIPRPIATQLPTPMPRRPEDVGCPPACGRYQPKVYACDECYLVATGDAG